MVSRGKIKRKARVIDYYYKQGGKCAYCKIGMTLSLGFQNTATIDHIIPKAHKRIKGVFNEVAACQKCNNITELYALGLYR